MAEKIEPRTIKEKIINVKDNDLNLTLGDLDAIKDITISGDKVSINISLVQPILWASQDIKIECNKILNDALPDFEFDYKFSEIEEPVKERDFLKGVKNIIAVASGKGGVGKSAISANIAAALADEGAKTGLLDGDVYGPSQPTMYGLTGTNLEAVELPDGRTVAYPQNKYGVKVASMGFVLKRDEAAIVRGPMLAGYFSMLFEQVEWGDLDFLIFDLPPGTGDIQLTLTQKIPLKGSVVVTTPQEIAVADVRRAIAMFNRVDVKILGIVENMSWFTPPDLPDNKYFIFGEGGGRKVAEEKGVELLGEIPLDIDMREGNDNGRPAVINEITGSHSKLLKNMTMNMVKELRKHNYNLLETNLEIDV